MIIDAFTKEEGFLGPADFYEKKEEQCDKCMIIFSKEIFQFLLDTYPHKENGEIKCCNGTMLVYIFTIDGMEVVSYLTDIGSALAASDLIDVNWLTGATKFVMFGSAGSLDAEKTNGKYVIPTESYRDEGMSYHYAPPADYITIKNAGRVKEIFTELQVPYVEGRVWTTDAMYRETRGKVAQRKAEGCIAVEMELAGVQAVCDYHGLELYNFLQTGDVLDAPQYDKDGLHDANHDLDKLFIGIEILKRI